MRRQNSQTAWHDSMPDVTGLSSPMLLTDVEDNPGIGLPLELPPIVEDITEPNIDAGETAKRSATAPVQCRSLAISSKDTSEYNITAQFQVLKNLGDTIASRAKEHLDFSNSHLATYITKKADLATLNISLRAKTSELEQLPTVDGLLTEGDMFANKSASVSLFSQYAKEMGDLLQKMRQTTRVEEKSLNHRINTLKVELSDCQTNLKLAGTFALQSVDDARREISELEASACAAEKLVEHFRKNARVNRDRLMALEVTPELAEAKAATSET
ncbi:hypothetical protein EJ05DRAFT_232133 [Pseudovirgaria hyperparasitica]|uniref:Uncharacterized protein n=1 Tax=Pseudovirgaria hyperparasitica TaxID=470096 RepID=A0A6A6VUN4_9PEZI|nr:uncharacterized protein EJ05DRAFT_232133 [Pseudovirgaria hyperparasitica]KAF2752967.1 hypothetical protein EJ05DRAFT_232133 [Pseudovirgaria hyperparasitica]